MATQTVEFQAVTGQSVTAKLFAVGSDTEVASVSATEATNRKGLYSAAYTDVAAGTYDLIAFVATTPVARWQVVLTLTTATFQAYEPIYTADITAIKAKTDNLPSDPADQSAVEAAITAAIATIPTAGQNADAVWDEAMADHTGSTTYGGRIVRATNSNVTVQITGSNHVAADVHAFQTDVIDATAFASSAVTEIQSGLATAAELAKVPKSGETRRYTQVAADSGNKTADVSIGAPL